MPGIEETLDELKYPLTLLVGRHLADSSVSDEEIRLLRDKAVALVVEICDQPRNFFFRANFSEQSVNKVLTASRAPVVAPKGKVTSGTSPNASQLSATSEKKEAVIKLLGGSKAALSINDVMTALHASGHADESQRGTVLSMLRRLRVRDGLLDSPHEGHYQLSASGRTLYTQLRSPPAIPAK